MNRPKKVQFVKSEIPLAEEFGEGEADAFVGGVVAGEVAHAGEPVERDQPRSRESRPEQDRYGGARIGKGAASSGSASRERRCSGGPDGQHSRRFPSMILPQVGGASCGIEFDVQEKLIDGVEREEEEGFGVTDGDGVSEQETGDCADPPATGLPPADEEVHAPDNHAKGGGVTVGIEGQFQRTVELPQAEEDECEHPGERAGDGAGEEEHAKGGGDHGNRTDGEGHFNSAEANRDGVEEALSRRIFGEIPTFLSMCGEVLWPKRVESTEGGDGFGFGANPHGVHELKIVAGLEAGGAVLEEVSAAEEIGVFVDAGASDRARNLAQ